MIMTKLANSAVDSSPSESFIMYDPAGLSGKMQMCVCVVEKHFNC